MIRLLPYISIFFLFFSCEKNTTLSSNTVTEPKSSEPFSLPSDLPNTYQGFQSPHAINKLVDIETEYFTNFPKGLSKYYGTIWRKQLVLETDSEEETLFKNYCNALGKIPDSMHCTIYAVEGLKAGLGDDFEKLETLHRQTYGKHEHAGWSIGYLLTQHFGWKAYLIIDKNSPEFIHCKKAFAQKKSYPVWRQPNISLENLYVLGEQDSIIQQLLNENEFGWGFSEQGIHTWITRFEILKECNWLGAPGATHDTYGSAPLFIKTPFLSFHDYASHVIVFPPKME